MGDLEAAHQHFQDALSVARRAEITPILMEALVGEARVQVEEGYLESAFAIAWSVSQHPSGSYVTHVRAEKLYLNLQQVLTRDEVESAKQKYKTIDEVTQVVLGVEA
jgi:hypothetical protein